MWQCSSASAQPTTVGNSFVLLFSINSKPLLRVLQFLTCSAGTKTLPFSLFIWHIATSISEEMLFITLKKQALDYPGVFLLRTKVWTSVNSSCQGRGVLWDQDKLKLQTRVVHSKDVLFSKKLHSNQKLNILQTIFQNIFVMEPFNF